MRFISLSTILVHKDYMAKINNLRKHLGAGPIEAWGPIRAGLKGRGAWDNFYWKAPMT